MQDPTHRSGEDHRSLVRAAVLDEETFLRLTFSKPRRSSAIPWIKVSVRPVLIQGRRRLQFTYFDARKGIAKNDAGEQARQRLDELLALPFDSLHLQSSVGDLHIRITRKGKVLIGRGKPSRPERQPILEHDRIKQTPLTAETSLVFLRAIGILTSDGQVRAARRGKFRQINEFVRIVEQAVQEAGLAGHPLHLVDCGCGNAYLTFAAHHYFNHVKGQPVMVTGIDRNAEIIAECERLREAMGWSGLEFQVGTIADYLPGAPPDMVLSLHACDTATDEAIAQGIRWGSRIILAAPCCQHELHHQLQASLFRPLLRHGILRERLADLLTDTFRALVLRIMGYRTRVFQFIDPEHTAKNVMIRAEKGLPVGDPAFIKEFSDLKRFWQVEPCIERLLGDQMPRL